MKHFIMQFLLSYLVFFLMFNSQYSWGSISCSMGVFQTFGKLQIEEVTYRLNHVMSNRYLLDDTRRVIKSDPSFVRDRLRQFKAEWTKAKNPFLPEPDKIQKQLVKIGFSKSVAAQIVMHDTSLAVDIITRSQTTTVKVFKVYRGVSIAPEEWDPKMGEFAERGDFSYAIGFASGAEGRGRSIENELEDIRQEGHKHWGVLIEMEIPDFLYSDAKSTGTINVANQAVVARRFGTFYLGQGKMKLKWFKLNEIQNELKIDTNYLFKEGIEMMRIKN